jgi:hypothetical protein
MSKANAAGIHYQNPVDDRLGISTEREILYFGKQECPGSVMYDGMVVTFADSKRTFIW